jgi:thioredoxin-dependent peroxiredoxin
MLKVGDKAPIFNLPNAAMDSVSLDDYRHRKHVVLYFFPKLSMPTCAQLAEDYSDHESDFEELHTSIMAISPEDCLALDEFQDEHGLSMPLLSDADCEVAAQYGVLKPKQGDPTGRQVITRSTFVIDRDGVIRHVLVEGAAKGHAVQVLNLVREMDTAVSNSDSNAVAK